jgi:hypothetical protein
MHGLTHRLIAARSSTGAAKSQFSNGHNTGHQMLVQGRGHGAVRLCSFIQRSESTWATRAAYSPKVLLGEVRQGADNKLTMHIKIG